MDAVASIRDRYDFTLPALYQTLLAKAHFSTVPWENYLELADCEWLTLEQIASYEFLDFQMVLPSAWGEELIQLAGQPFSAWKSGKGGARFVLSKDVLSAAISRRLAFPHLDERFEQDRDS